jgi:CTP:molybdopterin cytidylyltransferase MocA
MKSEITLNGTSANLNQSANQLLLSRSDAARALSMSTQALDIRIKNGSVPVVRIGDRPMIHVDTIRKIATEGLK